MKDIHTLFGQHLKKIRKARGYTQEELGERCGLTPQYIGEIERGIKNPPLSTLNRLANGLSTTLSQLLAIQKLEQDADGKIIALVSEANNSIKKKMLRAIKLFVD